MTDRIARIFHKLVGGGALTVEEKHALGGITREEAMIIVTEHMTVNEGEKMLALGFMYFLKGAVEAELEAGTITEQELRRANEMLSRRKFKNVPSIKLKEAEQLEAMVMEAFRAYLREEGQNT